MTEHPNRTVGYLAGALLLALAVGLGWLAIASDADPPSRAPQPGEAVTSLSLSYPDGWVTQDLKAVDDKAGLLAAAAHSGTGTTFLVRTVVGRLAKDVDLADLAEQTVTAMTASIQGFELEDREIGKVAGVDAITIVYRQKSQDTDFTTRMIVVPLPQQTLYLTARAAGDGLDETEGEVDRLVEETIEEVAA